MTKFFCDQRMREIAEKTIGDLTTPVGLDQHMTFTARRANTLIKHVAQVSNAIGQRCVEMFGGLQVSYQALAARVERLESHHTDPSDENEFQPQYVIDQVAQLRATVARLQQQVSSLSKQVVSIDRRTINEFSRRD